MRPHVPASGSLSALLYHVGEAPGRQEEKHRPPTPWIGASGQWTRTAYRMEGLRVDQFISMDVRFANVAPINLGRIKGGQRDRHALDWWDNISDDLARMEPKVIVACGGLALRRLTGLTDITDEHGSVIPAGELPGTVVVGGRPMELGLPRGTLIIPCLHPAGIMQTRIQGEKTSLDRILRRAARYANGTLEYAPVKPMLRQLARAEQLSKLAGGSDHMVIDVEYDRDTKVPFMIGVLFDSDPEVVYHLDLRKPVLNALQEVLDSPDILKIAHNYYVAEVDSLRRLGLDASRGPWWDTMFAHNALYPDTAKGLNHVAQFYLDDVRNWKDMAHSDPVYNGWDVFNDWRIFLLQRADAAQTGMMDLLINEVFPSIACLGELEIGGMQTDPVMQTALIKDNQEKRGGIKDKVIAAVREMYENRGKPLRAERLNHEAALGHRAMELELLVEAQDLTCPIPKHDEYRGERKKKWMTDPTCRCRTIYEHEGVTKLRDLVAGNKKEITKIDGKLKKWEERGFDPGNNYDLRWLLYDANGFGLPKQYKDGSITANADAVHKLCVSMMEAREKPRSKYHRKDAEEVVEMLTDIKEFQHLEKLESTFLTPPVDGDGVAHPPYTPGTGTGRIASGRDDTLVGDGGGSPYSWNALNVPEGCRGIIVPKED